MLLARFLEKKRIEHQEFARRVGISKAAMSRYIHREVTPPADVADRIIRATRGKVTIADLLPPQEAVQA